MANKTNDMLKDFQDLLDFKNETIKDLIKENQVLRETNNELIKNMQILLRENALLQNPNARLSVESRKSI